MAVAPAAPAVPALAYLVIGLLALLAWAVMRGLLAAWIYTFGAMLQRLADILTFRKLGVTVDLGGPIRTLDTTIRNVILKGATKAERLAGYFFHGCAVIVRWTAGEVEGLASDTLAWATWLQHAHLPKWVKAMVYAAFPPAAIYKLVQAAIHANLPHVGRTVTTKVEHVVTHTVTRIVRASSGAVAIPGWVIRLPSRVGDVEHDLSGLRKRVKGLEKYAGATAAVALFTAALAKLGLQWLRCKNMKKAGKRVCGLDGNLLDALLLGTTLIVGTISLREFAQEVESVTDEVSGLIHGFLRDA
jgi:hypothetical protein